MFMKLSTRGRYACRAAIVLARNYGRSVSIDKVAANQHISKRYLEHIFTRLRKAGIVAGTRGSRGGYVLTRPPEKVTVGQIIIAVEGPVGPVHCVEQPSTCEKSSACATHNLWKEAAVVLSKLFDGRTIAHLAREQDRLDAAKSARIGTR